MELKQFVADTLVQIMEGVREASAHQTQHSDGGQINPHPSGDERSKHLLSRETKTPIRDVEFDVAVTIAKDKESKGGVLAVIGPFTLGSSGKSGDSNSSVSRIKFTVPIGLPRP